MSGGRPLDADPECAQLAKLIIKQSRAPNFGLSPSQLRRLQSTSEGIASWNIILQSFSKNGKFDFGKWTRNIGMDNITALQQCLKSAKAMHPHSDPREFCVLQVLDTCKRIEHAWTQFVFHTTVV